MALRPPSTRDPATKCDELKAHFEGKEAIYVEKGVAKVRVFGIVTDVRWRVVEATVQHIPTKGMPEGRGFRPQRQIGAGDLSAFSRSCWEMGYAGSTMYFDPAVIAEVTRLAASFPDHMDEKDRYFRILEYIYLSTDAGKGMERIFADTI